MFYIDSSIYLLCRKYTTNLTKNAICRSRTTPTDNGTVQSGGREGPSAAAQHQLWRVAERETSPLLSSRRPLLSLPKCSSDGQLSNLFRQPLRSPVFSPHSDFYLGVFPHRSLLSGRPQEGFLSRDAGWKWSDSAKFPPPLGPRNERTETERKSPNSLTD